jgi:hypothetical protein
LILDLLIILVVIGALAGGGLLLLSEWAARRDSPASARQDPAAVEREVYETLYGQRSGQVAIVEERGGKKRAAERKPRRKGRTQRVGEPRTG